MEVKYFYSSMHLFYGCNFPLNSSEDVNRIFFLSSLVFTRLTLLRSQLLCFFTLMLFNAPSFPQMSCEP